MLGSGAPCCDERMANGLLQNLKHKFSGDRRDQRKVLREAGFANEAEAAAWGRGIISASGTPATELADVRKLREARPDLTLRTATYILHQVRTRSD